jgi:hypothetical protein
MGKKRKVIKIFSNGSLMFHNSNIFLVRNQRFVFCEKDFNNLSLFIKGMPNTSANLVEMKNLNYRKRYFS